MPRDGDEILHRPTLGGAILGAGANRDDQPARAAHGRRLLAQFWQRGIAGAEDRSDEIEIIVPLVQPRGISRRRRHRMGQEKAPAIQRVADPVGNARHPRLGGDAQRVRQQDRSVELSVGQLLRRMGEIFGLLQRDDAIDKRAFFPERGELFRRGHGQLVFHEHGPQVADGGERHDRIAQPVGAAHDQGTTKRSDMFRHASLLACFAALRTEGIWALSSPLCRRRIGHENALRLVPRR